MNQGGYCLGYVVLLVRKETVRCGSCIQEMIIGGGVDDFSH